LHAQPRDRVEVERHLALDEDALVACVACGLCLPHCPTYRVTGLEIASPRGRIAAMRAVQLEGAAWDGAFADAMEACVQCRGCEAACPSSVPFGKLMEGTRAALHESPARHVAWHRRAAAWVGYRVVLPRHHVLAAVGWLLAIAQRLHLVPRRFGIPKLHLRSLAAALPVGEEPCDAYLFRGCVMSVWQRDVHRAAISVMNATGASVGRPGRGGACCGALHEHAGRSDGARRLARRVIASMPGDAAVVVDSAGCGAAMKDYGRWLGTDEAVAFSHRVRDFSEWLVGVGVPPVRAVGRRVVVQDPCHLRHVQRADAAVRTVLHGAYEVLETDDDGLCCGAGGLYSVTEPELAASIRARKVAAIRDAAGGAPVVVASANPGCAMHLAAVGLDVRHPAELVADALRDRAGANPRPGDGGDPP
jgi:glycolate dehydrogenase iron-sulfur subunit